jgi:NAD(P)H-nitrite reductase large subunit
MIDQAEAMPCFVCRCEEIPGAEVRRAIAEGARTVDDVKRRTKAGMGLCQGIFCVATIAGMLGDEGAQAALPKLMTARPPVRPIPLEVVADSVIEDEG